MNTDLASLAGANRSHPGELGSYELGKEALNETAGWLMDHRHRPIENRVG